MSNPINSGTGTSSGNNGQVWVTGAGGGGGSWVTVPVPTQNTTTITIPLPNLFITGDLCASPSEPVTAKKSYKDGCVCKNCKELYPYAEPNQDDGTLICYGCRMVW